MNMSNKKFTDNEEIIQRLMKVLGIEKQTDLAKLLDYKGDNSISNWKKKGIDWNRVVEKLTHLDSPDMNYIIYGEPVPKQKKPIDDSWDRLKVAVTSRGITGEVRDRMIASLRDRAKNLAEDLLYFSDLVDRLEAAKDEPEVDESP